MSLLGNQKVLFCVACEIALVVEKRDALYYLKLLTMSVTIKVVKLNKGSLTCRFLTYCVIIVQSF